MNAPAPRPAKPRRPRPVEPGRAAAPAAPRDLSADAGAWRAISSDRARLALSATRLARGPALRLDYDFDDSGGFVVARRVLQRALPETFALRLRLRATGATNDLELKLLDASGQNVWRHVHRALAPSPRARTLCLRSHEFAFAWGPDSGGVLRALGAIEIALVAGDGGAGSLSLAGLEIVDETPREAPRARASSRRRGHAPVQALAAAGWCPRADDAAPWLELDLRAPRRLGALIVDWLDAAPAGGFRLRGSANGRRWTTLHETPRAGGLQSAIHLAPVRLRHLRLELHAPCAGLRLRLGGEAWARSIDAFWQQLAAEAPRGRYPRWLRREQCLWTTVGTPDGHGCALLNEDGMLEPLPGSFSIEPMLWLDGRLHGWADVRATPALDQGWMPAPSVCWHGDGWRLHIAASASIAGTPGLSCRFENLGDAPRTASLFLVLRPFQVTPPWQVFRGYGGVSPIHALAWRDGTVCVGDSVRVVPTTPAAGFGALTHDDGPITDWLAAGRLPPDDAVRDAFGFASGALRFALDAAPGASAECRLVCLPGIEAAAREAPAYRWDAKLRAGQWQGAGWAREAIAALLTSTAQILVTRSGPALQPGPRRYTRSWIRDATLMSAALLRMGCTREVRDFIRWYAPFQHADGFVPCVVDREGPDGPVEHDSHGQLIALIADYHAFSGDDVLLAEQWPAIDRAIGCLERLIASDRHGLLPISASHEGYLAAPVHAYWDDFWALRGLRDAARLADHLGHVARAVHCTVLATRLAKSVTESIAATRRRRAIDYVPGSLELGDHDPTSTANAVALLDLPEGIERAALHRTFDAYLERRRREWRGEIDAPKYTPYEIRIVGALVRLGRRAEALELLRFFLDDRRPPAWNQWPEIAWRDHRAPAHLGDLPHTWVAAEYVLAVRSLFVHECEAGRSLVLGAGLAPEWLDGDGVRVDAAPTTCGPLSYTLQRVAAQRLRWEIGGGVEAALVLRPPLPQPLHAVTVDGRPWPDVTADGVRLARAPAVVEMAWRA